MVLTTWPFALDKEAHMPDPIVFITRNRVRPGKLDEFRRVWSDIVTSIEASKPDTLVYLA
jgi:hypothetical protein